MNIILSITTDHHSSRSGWINQFQQLPQSISTQHGIHQIMLPVSRLGLPGLVPDNPPIDDVDQFLSDVSDSACEVGLISIPISANDLINKGGIEVSSINGWIDTAGYANCQHIRLCAIDGTLFTDETHWMFLEVVSYAVDLDITVSLQGFDEHYLQKTRNNFPQDHQQLIGIERLCKPLTIDAVHHHWNDGITNLLSTPFHDDLSTVFNSNELANCKIPILLNL